MAAPDGTLLDAACETAVGGRDYNQDRCYVEVLDPTQSLWGFRAALVVADGMGGHEKGDQAAQLAVDVAREVLAARLEDHWRFASGFPGAEPADVVRGAFERANQRIYEWAVTEDVSGDTGTTLTVVVCTDEEVVVGNVGDSKAYAIAQDKVSQLSEDHSWVGEQVKLGYLTEREAAVSPFRSQLTQAVGVDPSVSPYIVAQPLEAGAVFLACTDGLTEVVEAEAIAGVIHAGGTAEDFCRALVALAVAADTSDNVTVAALATGPVPVAMATAALPVADPEPVVQPETATPVAAVVETEEPVELRGGEPTMARQRNQRLGMVLIVCVVSLILGMLVGRATLPKDGAQARAPVAVPTTGPATPGTGTAPAAGALTGTAAEAGGVVVQARCEGDELIVTTTESLTLDVYPKGRFNDESAHLLPVEGGAAEANETRYRLPDMPPATWAGQTVELKVERAGEGALKMALEPDGEVFVDKEPYTGEALQSVKPAGAEARIGFHFPSGDDPKAYAIAIVAFPVEGP